MDRTQLLLALSVTLFSLGLLGVMVRRNVLVMLMCMELMLNGVILSLVDLRRARRDAGRRGARLPGVRGGRGRDRHRHPDRAAAVRQKRSLDVGAYSELKG